MSIDKFLNEGSSEELSDSLTIRFIQKLARHFKEMPCMIWGMRRLVIILHEKNCFPFLLAYRFKNHISGFWRKLFYLIPELTCKEPYFFKVI